MRFSGPFGQFLRRYHLVIVFVGLGSLISLLYLPALGALFNADDFSFLRFLHFNLGQLLNGQDWNEWFIGGVVNYSVFRPMGNLFWLVNYVAFGFEPYGYHIITVLFHLIASFAVFILCYLLVRNRVTAGMGAIIFAMMPVHAEAVAWIAANYDVLSGMYFFAALIFYILYRQTPALKNYLIALGAFVLALSSKETALTLPAMLFIYDLIFHFQVWMAPRRTLGVLLGYVPFGIVLALRFIYFGHGYRGLIFAPEGWLYYVDLNLLRVFNPLPEAPDHIRWVALALVVMLLLVYRLRGVVLFGLIWIPVTLFPTTVGGVSDRSFYIPSFGISLLLGVVLTSLLTHKAALAKVVGLFGLSSLIVIYSLSLFARNQSFARASQVADAILRQTKELHPAIPDDARLVFVGVPDAVPDGAPVFGAGFWEALNILYGNPSVRVFKLSKFPIWLDNLDHTYFFQVDHRKVTERADLVQQLKERKSCSNTPSPSVTWDFTRDTQGWEAWNDLSDLQIRDGALTTVAQGKDPYMATPEVDIPSITIGSVEIEMRVQSEQPVTEGQLFWVISGQQDFSPGLQKSFQVQADGTFHSYSINLIDTGMLLMDTRIARFRLDPSDVPAQIAIRSVRVLSPCSETAENRCTCIH